MKKRIVLFLQLIYGRSQLIENWNEENGEDEECRRMQFQVWQVDLKTIEVDKYQMNVSEEFIAFNSIIWFL